MTETTALPASTTSNPYVAAAPQPAPAAPASASSPFSIAALVLGIISIPTGLAVAAITAIVLGFVARAKEPAGRTMANWGLVLGFVGLLGGVVFAILGVLFALPFAALGFGWFLV